MKVTGTIRPPGDKSITQRALLFAALSDGRCSIHRPLMSADTRSMIGALRHLEVRVEEHEERVFVYGRGVDGLGEPAGDIDCGNSGTAARLLTGTLSGCQFSSRLVGDESLSRRPMRRVTEPLGIMGARFEEENGDGLPLRITGGQLKALEGYESPVASAQVKTALLMAGYVAGVEVSLREPVRSRDHTERMFSALGQDIRTDPTGVFFSPTRLFEAFDVEVPGDVSSAAFLIATALLADRGELRLECVGMNPTRAGFLNVVGRMGARIEVENRREGLGEPVADLIAKPSDLNATVVAAEEVASLIDEVPILSVLAARASGETSFEGVRELRYKESNRLEGLAANLRAIGVDADAADDRLAVCGGDGPLKGGVQTHDDHRIAMAFSVLGLLDDVTLGLSERDSPVVSYPGFFDHLEEIVS